MIDYTKLDAYEACRQFEIDKAKEAQTPLPDLLNLTLPAPVSPKRGHTILIQVRIESPENAGADTITPGSLEREIKSAIMRSNRIIDAIEIDKIEVEADLNYQGGQFHTARIPFSYCETECSHFACNEDKALKEKYGNLGK